MAWHHETHFLTWSRRAAVAINHPENRAGWWRIEEEIEVKRSRSQDLKRGRGCDQFFRLWVPATWAIQKALEVDPLL